ncbi:MAG: LysM peptidoglycan-binding domain-containing protein [Pseudomonadota bacterium]
MSNVVVERGQSLWSIARSQLPGGSSDATIQQAVRDIAKANGLAPDARLKPHQTLVIPDAYTGVSASNTVAESLPRLSTAGSSANVLTARLGATAKPLVSFKAIFSDTVRKDLGAVDLPAIAGTPVLGQRQRYEGLRSSIGEASLNTVDARLGTLSREQFDAVHAQLGGRSGVTYDAGRDYRVVDFLPPALQALLHKDLEIPEPVEIMGTKKLVQNLIEQGGMLIGDDPEGANLDVNLTMNCHATAWEAARAYQGTSGSVAVFYGEMITMDGLCQDPKLFDKVGEVDAAHIKDLTRLDLKPGDLVQFHEVSDWARMTMLLHTAVYVGGGLFFEKPNTEGPEKADPARYIQQDETPFRLATLDDMVAPLSDAVEGKFRVEVLRPRVSLEDPGIAFASSVAEPVTQWAGKKGRQLGVELVSEFEQGMGGGIRAEHVSALVRVPVVTQDDGTAVLG